MNMNNPLVDGGQTRLRLRRYPIHQDWGTKGTKNWKKTFAHQKLPGICPMRARAGHPDPRARRARGAEYRGRHLPRLRLP
jgi:hypothetical protein